VRNVTSPTRKPPAPVTKFQHNRSGPAEMSHPPPVASMLVISANPKPFPLNIYQYAPLLAVASVVDEVVARIFPAVPYAPILNVVDPDANPPTNKVSAELILQLVVKIAEVVGVE
jgi:hypothetical protein